MKCQKCQWEIYVFNIPCPNCGFQNQTEGVLLKIGRHAECELMINSGTVSRFHAEIHAVDGEIYLVDKNSTNGTFVNGQIIEPEKFVLISKNDTIKVGPVDVDWVTMLESRIRIEENLLNTNFDKKANPDIDKHFDFPEIEVINSSKSGSAPPSPPIIISPVRPNTPSSPPPKTRGHSDDISIFSKIINWFKSDRSGTIVASIPKTLQLNQREEIIIRIGKASLERLREGLKKEQLIEEEIEMGKVMEVTLFEVGNQNDLTIIPLNTSEQIIDFDDVNEWKFQILSERIGFFNLFIRISVKVHVKNLGEKTKDILVWSREVEVKVEQPKASAEAVALEIPKWNEDFEHSIIQLIKNGETGKTFETLTNYLQRIDLVLCNQLILLHSRWNTNRNEYHQGRIKFQDWEMIQNQINHGLLNLLEEVKVMNTDGKKYHVTPSLEAMKGVLSEV